MISTVKFHFKIWQITSNSTDKCCENKDNCSVDLSFGHVSPFMFYSGTALLQAHFLWLNAWIESCVAASLIINWPCWYLHQRGGLTSACSWLHTSNPLTIGYKRAVLAGMPNKTGCFWKDCEAELFLIGCNVGHWTRQQNLKAY